MWSRTGTILISVCSLVDEAFTTSITSVETHAAPHFKKTQYDTVYHGYNNRFILMNIQKNPDKHDKTLM